MRAVRVLFFWLVLSAVGRVAIAQCPNGSPPPCRVGRIAAPAPNSVAVLYFENLSRDTADAYLVDGLTEAIIDRLGRVPRLIVKSREAVRRFRERQAADPDVVGRALKASYLVGGSVRHAAGRLRVTVELLRSSSGDRLWGERYDRAETDLFVIESEIAEAVASAVVGRLLPVERRAIAERPTQNLEAYRFYLRGRFALNLLTEQSIRAALGYFKRAISIDSLFAPAYGGLADAYNLLADYEPPRDLIASMRAAAEQAARLQPNSPDALNALGSIQYSFDWDPTAAEQTYRRALALAPLDALTRQRLAELLVGEGQFELAIAESKRAVELDSSAVGSYVGVLILARRYTEAIAVAQTAVSTDPTDFVNRLFLGFAQALSRRCDEGIDQLERARAMQPGDPYVLAVITNAYAWCNRRKDAHDALDELEKRSQRSYVPAVSMAYAFTGLGERDSAFAWMERAVNDRSAHVVYLKIHPLWDPLRPDPRFATLLRRTGLQIR
jgi:serine/threonine-protein kinase